MSQTQDSIVHISLLNDFYNIKFGDSKMVSNYFFCAHFFINSNAQHSEQFFYQNFFFMFFKLPFISGQPCSLHFSRVACMQCTARPSAKHQRDGLTAPSG